MPNVQVMAPKLDDTLHVATWSKRLSKKTLMRARGQTSCYNKTHAREELPVAEANHRARSAR